VALRDDFPQYYYLFSTKNFLFSGKRYHTHNQVLLNYKGAEGLKTGFTQASGFNLISAAKRKDFRVVSVLLGCEKLQKRDQLTKNLLDTAFERLEKEKSHGERYSLNLKLN
jgi:D-alanyl-D-alanine carboxypeptidase